MKKKRTILTVLVLALLCCALCMGTLVAFAAETTAKWSLTEAQDGVTCTVNSSGIATFKTGAGFTAGTPIHATYGETVNFNEGVRFRYGIPSANSVDTNVDGETRELALNYFKFTAVNSQGVGFEITSYGLHTDAESNGAGLRKMQSDIVYLDPSIEADMKYCSEGRENIETFDTYVSTDKKVHSIDFHKETGFDGQSWWFIAIDGLTAMPVRKLSNVDLSDCTVTFEYYTKTKSVIEFRLYPADNQVGQYILDDWLTFGSDERTELGDDTIRYKIADKIAAVRPGAEIRYREQFISTVGYDVRKPIHIEYSYDVSNASAVWYAVGLGRPGVLETIDKVRYSFEGKATGGYSDAIAAKNDGIMFQTGKGQAQPTYQPQNNRLNGYQTNSPSAGYKGRSSVDIITFIVKEEGTDMYHNGKLIFDNLVTKLSDFADSNYMAYPYFHFFEDNASTSKGNTIVIKGINAARRIIPEGAESAPALRVTAGSGKDVTVEIDPIYGTGITLSEYVDGTLTALDASLYSYDLDTKVLTIKHAAFDGKAYGEHAFYADNGCGSEEIVVRLSDPALATIPPSFSQDTYYWKLKAGTEDLVIPVDIGTGEYVSFSGGGLQSLNFNFTPGTDSTLGTITIKKEFLNGKNAGSFTFTIRTKNVEEDVFTAQVKVVINKTGEAPVGGEVTDPGNSENPGQTGDEDANGESGSKKKKCGSTAAGASAVAATALLLPAMGLLCLRRKRKNA